MLAEPEVPPCWNSQWGHAARGVTLHRDGEDKEQHWMPLFEGSPVFETLQSVAHLDHEGQKGPAPASPLGSPIALLLVPGTRELHAWQLSPFSTPLSSEMMFSPAEKKPKYAQWDESTPRILTHQEGEFRDLSNEMRWIWASYLPASTLPQKWGRREVSSSQILPFNKPQFDYLKGDQTPAFIRDLYNLMLRIISAYAIPLAVWA